MTFVLALRMVTMPVVVSTVFLVFVAMVVSTVFLVFVAMGVSTRKYPPRE